MDVESSREEGEKNGFKNGLLTLLTSNSKHYYVEKLYKSPFATSCIFEVLSSIQKTVLSRLLFVDVVPMQSVFNWFQKLKYSQLQTAVNELVSLKIVHKKQETQDSVMLEIHPSFQKSLQQMIFGKATSPFDRQEMENEQQEVSTTLHNSNQETKDTTLLEQHSRLCWNKICHFLVGSWNTKEEKILQCGLLEEFQDGFRITQLGFQFLLKDMLEQIWFILHGCLFSVAHETETQEFKETHQQTHVEELLELFFELSFCAPGKPYPAKALSKVQRNVMPLLVDLGLLYKNAEDAEYFYVTPMGIHLVSSVDWTEEYEKNIQWKDFSVVSEDCRLIVQTNFRVYVYTNSAFQISLLSLFIQFIYRLPNLAIGMITRESIRTALSNGISAEQMISYLQKHTHSVTKGKLPLTVIDQIRLWEAQRFRVHMTDAILLDHFESPQQFDKAVSFSKELGAYLWSNEHECTLVIAQAAEAAMKQFLRGREKSLVEKVDELFEARTFFYLQNFPRAKEEALSSEPSSAELVLEKQVLLGRIDIAQGNYDEVIDSQKDATNEDLMALRQYAVYLKNPIDTASAIQQQIQDWMQSNKGDIGGAKQILYASILVHHGQYEQALELLRHSPTLETAALEVQILLGMNRIDLAKKLVERLNQLEGDAILTHLTTAWLYLAQGAYREAAYIFSDLSERHGSSDMLMNGIITTHLGEQRYQDAENILKELLARNPNHPQALLNCILCGLQLRKPKEQVDVYKQQLKRIWPDCPWLKELEQMEDKVNKVLLEYL
eukprot:jgi/Galph1/217/GphlegSOOS_G4919.1